MSSHVCRCGHRHRRFVHSNVQEFDTRWNEVLLFMSEIPSDEVLESLYTLRIHESEQLKTVLELYEMEIH